jgi:hypothetical protein
LQISQTDHSSVMGTLFCIVFLPWDLCCAHFEDFIHELCMSRDTVPQGARGDIMVMLEQSQVGGHRGTDDGTYLQTGPIYSHL